MKRDYPKSDDDVLYISAEYEEPTIGEILERIRDHFGVNSALDSVNDFRIECENIKVSGCYCHPDPSDYIVYMVIRRPR